MQVRELPAPLGAEVTGLDLRAPITQSVSDQLNAAFADRHVLVIRNQYFSPQDFLRAAEVFGELRDHENPDSALPDCPTVNYVSSHRLQPDGSISPRDIVPGGEFHTDHSNHARPPKASTLYAVSLPAHGGDTQFVNMHDAYSDLSEETKARIARLKVVHTYLSKYSPRKVSAPSAHARAAIPPPSVHPLVRVHPENRRPALYLNPVRTEAIVGMNDDDAQQLLRELFEHATRPRYEYRHQWRLGDMVIWDNRSVLHKANPDYGPDAFRLLYQVLLVGSEPVGMDAESDAVKRQHLPSQAE